MAAKKDNPRIPRKKGQRAMSKKHSDLYTDENPKGTIKKLGFKDVKTAQASVRKIKASGRSHAHKTQAAIAMEQSVRETTEARVREEELRRTMTAQNNKLQQYQQQALEHANMQNAKQQTNTKQKKI